MRYRGLFALYIYVYIFIVNINATPTVYDEREIFFFLCVLAKTWKNVLYMLHSFIILYIHGMGLVFGQLMSLRTLAN